MGSMKPRHPQHHYLRESPPLPALGVAPATGAADAARAADPFASASALNLVAIWAASLGVEPSAALIGRDRDTLLAAVLACLLGPEDVVALAGPADPALKRAILIPGARWVDVGRDLGWSLQTEALERVIFDQAASVCVFCRPGPLGLPLDALAPIERALDAGLTVVVDEEFLAWAPPDAVSALALLGAHPDRLVVLRAMPAAGLGDLGPALAVAPGLASRFRAALPQRLPEPALAGALAALADPMALVATARAAAHARDALAATLAVYPDLLVAASGGPRLLVKRRDGGPFEPRGATVTPWTDADSALRDAVVLTL
jgi:histidinol-phosphate/aromatic aminotransferase/cobyric acid decarboxylase-like protein